MTQEQLAYRRRSVLAGAGVALAGALTAAGTRGADSAAAATLPTVRRPRVPLTRVPLTTVPPAVIARPGDSLSSLGLRYHLPWRSIADMNGFPRANPTGQLLVDAYLKLLPDGQRYPGFRSSVSLPTAAVLATYCRVPGPVPTTSLRVITARYVDFTGIARTGQLLVNQTITAQLTAALHQMYDGRFPIEFMGLTVPAGASPTLSNTACYSCRPVRGQTTGWSQHAYGLAVDVNSYENPQVRNGRVTVGGATYANRAPYGRGMVHRPGVVDIMRRHGFYWGGLWRSQQDYMHFSTTNR